MDFKCEIIKQIGVLSESKGGWKKELNLISWNGKKPKYDLRSWSSDHEKQSKGITLTEDELRELKGLIDLIEDAGGEKPNR